MELKNLLKNEEQVWFEVEEVSRKDFLAWAKENNCSWANKPIEVERDECGLFMGIDKNLVLGYVGGHCWFEAKNAPQKINFKEIKGE